MSIIELWAKQDTEPQLAEKDQITAFSAALVMGLLWWVWRQINASRPYPENGPKQVILTQRAAAYWRLGQTQDAVTLIQHDATAD